MSHVSCHSHAQQIAETIERLALAGLDDHAIARHLNGIEALLAFGHLVTIDDYRAVVKLIGTHTAMNKPPRSAAADNWIGSIRCLIASLG
ncbi:MAG: hypothetical protein ACYTF0_03680 [Planctomycetota bacterium]|jgi:hypothetical protein